MGNELSKEAEIALHILCCWSLRYGVTHFVLGRTRSMAISDESSWEFPTLGSTRDWDQLLDSGWIEFRADGATFGLSRKAREWSTAKAARTPQHTYHEMRRHG